MRKSVNRKNSIIVLAAILATVLTACGAPATAAVTTEDIQPVVEKAQEVVEEVVTEETVTEVTKAVEQVVEEVVAEPTPEPTPEPIVYEGIDYESTLPVEDWVETFVGIIDEPKAVIYNAETNKHIILEGGERVFLEEGDEFGIYNPEVVEGAFPYDSSTGPMKGVLSHAYGTHYFPIAFNEERFTRGYDFSFTFGDTKLSFFLIPPGSEF